SGSGSDGSSQRIVPGVLASVGLVEKKMRPPADCATYWGRSENELIFPSHEIVVLPAELIANVTEKSMVLRVRIRLLSASVGVAAAMSTLLMVVAPELATRSVSRLAPDCDTNNPHGWEPTCTPLAENFFVTSFQTSRRL